MNYNAITIPRDFDRFPEFRNLCRELSELDYSEAVATHVFIKLWVELAYLALCYVEPLPPLGCLPETDFESWYNGLGFGEGDLSGDELKQALINSGVLRSASGMLHCMLFFLFNEYMDRSVRNAYSLADEGAFKRRWTRFSKAQQERWRKSGVPEVYLTVVDGHAITERERNQIDVIIRIIDAMFNRPLRCERNFGVGLIQDACRFVRRFSPKQIELIIRRLQDARASYKLPRTSEWTLAHIDAAMNEVAPKQGWEDWGRVILEAK